METEERWELWEAWEGENTEAPVQCEPHGGMKTKFEQEGDHLKKVMAGSLKLCHEHFKKKRVNPMTNRGNELYETHSVKKYKSLE